MNKAIKATQQHFESSSERTPEYLAWHRMFKREFTAFLTSKGAAHIVIGKPNHFDMSGFFTLGNTIWYFRIEDLRWSKDSMLLRMADHYQDFTGGRNHFVSMMIDGTDFIQQFNEIIDRNENGALFSDVSTNPISGDDAEASHSHF